jgi:CII-binding regulator of phage lambda lysogenization HflD|tara:strand:+ start:2013 stop:2222 length:210 start_codon:yes stop_codon:yes gene_type:complete
MLLDNMFYNHFDLMRPKVMVVSEKMYQEAQQKKLQARLDYLEEQKEHYENEIKEVKEEMTSLSIEDKSK